MGEYHEAERVFQLAQKIWFKRGFPKTYDQPLWADQLRSDGMLRGYGSYVQKLRAGVEKGDPAARAEMAKTLQKHEAWYHNIVYAPGVMSHPANSDYPASRWRLLDKL